MLRRVQHRIDLLVIYPVLAVASLVALGVAGLALRARFRA